MNICITGVSRGLGLALAGELAARGHRVWGVARTESAPADLRAAIESGQCTYTKVDVASLDALQQWKRAMERATFTPDVVILNASIQLDDLEDAGYDHALGRQVIDVNIQGALNCIVTFLPAFLERRHGSFVLIGSSVSLRPSMRSAAYAASKAGMTMAMRTLRMKYGSRGVRFAVATLGPIATEMWEGKKSILVPTVGRAAKRVADFAVHGGEQLYYPFLSMLLLRLSLWLPDRVFTAVSGRVMK